MTGNERVAAIKRVIGAGKDVCISSADGMTVIRIIGKSNDSEKTIVDKNINGKSIQNSAFDELVEYAKEIADE